MEVRIIEPLWNMTVGQRIELVCQSSGSRPPAKIMWRKNQKLLEHYSESTSDDGAVTTNFLTFIPTKEDDGKLLTCIAYNPQFNDLRIESSLQLSINCNVNYKLWSINQMRSACLSALDEPILSLLLGASVQLQEIVEGNTVYFDCDIQVSFNVVLFPKRSFPCYAVTRY